MKAMWECKIIESLSQALNFLNEKNIKPENCKITEGDDCLLIFYYIEK